MMRRQPQNQQDHRFKDFYELSAFVLNIIRSPLPSIDFSDQNPVRGRSGPSFQQITPAGFAALLLGISLSLMLCGSVTFFIGFVLMPWVLGMVICLYFVGVVTSISMIGRAILSWNPTPPSPRKGAAYSKMFPRMIMQDSSADVLGRGHGSFYEVGRGKAASYLYLLSWSWIGVAPAKSLQSCGYFRLF